MRNPTAPGRALPGDATPRVPRASLGGLSKRLLLTGLLLCALLALVGCQAVDRVSAALDATPQADTAGPNLALLALPPYADAATGPEATGDGSQAYAQVDLWLDATPVMGGVNVTGSNMYPAAGRKYREGGFHYHYGTLTGWYQNVLEDFLIAVGDARVRVLRNGIETFPQGALAAQGLPEGDDAGADSVWRDLHTCAQNADAALFASLSGEEMAGSFYEPGAAAWVNRLGSLNASALENPTLADAMGRALDAQVEGIASGDASNLLSGQGERCALYEALSRLDTTRLSILTVDPAALGDMTGADASGAPVAWYEQVLAERGVFDAGLCVGVLDFQLDYLGQISSVCSAKLSEPLIWGRVILNEKTQTFLNLGVMPRRLLTLVIGPRALVDGFLEKLDTALGSDPALQGLRGPQNGELTYAAAGQTVTQQPFGFEYHATVIARPGMGYYTQETEGATLTLETDGANAVGSAKGAAQADGAVGAADAVGAANADSTAEAAGAANAAGAADAAGAANADSTAEAAGAASAAGTADAAGAANADSTAEAAGAASAAGTTDAFDSADAASTANPDRTVGAEGAAEVVGTANADSATNADSAIGAPASTSADGLPLVTLPAEAFSAKAPMTLTVRIPLDPGADGASLDVSALEGAKLETLSTLLLASVLPNSAGSLASLAADAQSVAYRDKLYVFTPGQEAGAFSLSGIQRDGDALVCRVTANGAALKPGYYRLRIAADATAAQVAWESVPWIDGAQSVSASVSNRDAYAWVTFTAAVTQYDRDAKGLQKMFQHAWGEATDKLYHGLRVPDFPPVYKSIRLAELAQQLRQAAAPELSPLIRYTFEVFVPNP